MQSANTLAGSEILRRGQAMPSCASPAAAFRAGIRKALPACMGELGLIPGLGRSPREGKGYPLQYSGLENSMDWIVHGVAKSRTRLSDFHSLTHSPTCMNNLGAALRRQPVE